MGLLTRIHFAPQAQIRVIEPCAFCECSNLESIIIPASVDCLDDEAFADCISLASIAFSLSSRLSRIGKCAFDSCEDLISIVIPSSVQILDNNCFQDCPRLEEIRFCRESILARIGDGAFQFCLALTKCIVPGSVEYIGKDCFEGCGSLSIFRIASPSRLRELLSLPPFLCGSLAIPDSVEVLKFRITPCTRQDRSGRCTLTFGRESRLHEIATYGAPSEDWRQVMIQVRTFVRLSTGNLKIIRMIQEFKSADTGHSLM